MMKPGVNLVAADGWSGVGFPECEVGATRGCAIAEGPGTKIRVDRVAKAAVAALTSTRARTRVFPLFMIASPLLPIGLTTMADQRGVVTVNTLENGPTPNAFFA